MCFSPQNAFFRLEQGMSDAAANTTTIICLRSQFDEDIKRPAISCLEMDTARLAQDSISSCQTWAIVLKMLLPFLALLLQLIFIGDFQTIAIAIGIGKSVFQLHCCG